MAIPGGIGPTTYIISWFLWVYIWVVFTADMIYFIMSGYQIMNTILHFFLFFVYPFYAIFMVIFRYIYWWIYCPLHKAGYKSFAYIEQKTLQVWNWVTDITDTAVYYGKSITKNTLCLGVLFIPSTCREEVQRVESEKAEIKQRIYSSPKWCKDGSGCLNSGPITSPFSMAYFFCPSKRSASQSGIACKYPSPAQFNDSSAGFAF